MSSEKGSSVRPHTMDCKWTLEEAAAEEVTKKQLIEYLTEVAPAALKEKHKINKSALKKLSKDKALAAYKVLHPLRSRCCSI